LAQPIDYLDFDLELQPDGARYRVRVLQSPSGETHSTFELPFDTELENYLLKLGQPRRGVRRMDSSQTKLAKDFGGMLFKKIFAAEVLASLQSSIEQAERQRCGLRVRLRMNEAPALALLPWEYLYNASTNEFLALNLETPIVRYLALPRRILSLGIKPPLRILVVISSPKGLSQLDTHDEWLRLSKALEPLQQTGQVVRERLKAPRLDALQQRLQGSDLHILHFIGHGGLDAGAQDGMLVFEDDYQNQRTVTGEQLGVVLRNHPSLRLVVLNACDGARSSQDDPFAGVAQSLVQQGLPAVIAMQFEISDEAARVFASGFYSALASGYPVDAALVQARTAIHGNQLGAEWGTPVLFMRSPDGRLFDIPTQDLSQIEAKFTAVDTRRVRGWWPLELAICGLIGLLFLSVISSFLFRFPFANPASSAQGDVGHFSIALASLAGLSALALTLGTFNFLRFRWLSRPAVRTCCLVAIVLSGLGYGYAEMHRPLIATLSVPLAPPANQSLILNLVVRDATSDGPISAAMVDLFSDDHIINHALTDSNGVFAAEVVSPPATKTTIEVSHKDYQTVRLAGPFQPGGTIIAHLQRMVKASLPVAFKATFRFRSLPMNVSSMQGYHYGFSSLELDRALTGDRVRIRSVRVELKILAHSSVADCDTWVLLGPSPFAFNAGGVSGGPSPYDIVPSLAVAPTQVRLVLGTPGNSVIPKESEASFRGTYDFESGKPGGDYRFFKESYGGTMKLRNGLYAQVFVWTGNPNVNVDVEGITLFIEGETSG
jgi:hypothetical protein